MARAGNPLVKKLMKRLRKVERLASNELMCSVYSTFNATDGIAVPLIGAATIRRMINVAQGDNVIDREGNQIKPIRFDYRAILQNADAASQAVRIILFYWNSDTVPAVTDIVLNPAAGVGVANTPMQNINEVSVANKHLSIIHDKVYFLTANASGNGASVRSVRIRKRATRPVYFNDTAAANMTRGYYYLVYGTDVDSTVQDGINFYYYD